jgi:hypothetical protein
MVDRPLKLTQAERTALAEAMVEAEALGGSQAFDFNVHVWKTARRYQAVSSNRRAVLRFADVVTWVALGGLLAGTQDFRLWMLGLLIVGALIGIIAVPKPGFSRDGS